LTALTAVLATLAPATVATSPVASHSLGRSRARPVAAASVLPACAVVSVVRTATQGRQGPRSEA
jgi:hypothetical protein